MTKSAEIDERLAEIGGWRGELLGRMRDLIQKADPAVWKDPRNSRAVVTFLLSGGSPQVVAALRSRNLLSLDEAMLDGAIAYVEGRADEASERSEQVVDLCQADR